MGQFKDVVVYLEEDKELELKREFAFIIGNVVSFDEVIPGKGAANLLYPTDEDWTKMQAAVKKALKELTEQTANLTTNEE